LLRGREAYDFDGIATGDESWFHYYYEPCEMFAASRENVTPFVRPQLEVQKVIITVFFPSMILIGSEATPKGRKFNQHYLISTVLPELMKTKGRLLRRNPAYPQIIRCV
jgi:hypothetical protein